MQRDLWRRLCPLGTLSDPVLEAIDGALSEPETLSRLDQAERDERYPAEVIERLKACGLMALFAGDEGRPVSLWHLAALNVMAAQVSGSLAITLGVNALALLPVYIGASESQRQEIFGRVRAGAFSALLLTELAHGSNLARNEARAEGGTIGAGGFEPAAVATHYRVRGEKQLINGGHRHEILVALLRTRDPSPASGDGELVGAARDFSLLRVPRGPGVEPLPRWRTLPAHAADISGVRFAGAVVPAENVIGGEGNGFPLVQQALAISRGGVSALAAGAASRARELAVDYAQERDIYGQPIVHLDAIADHLLRIEALELLAAAASLKAAAALNARGPAAVHYGCVAKLASCALAEEAVAEGRRVLGARALLRDLPYERLLRDVVLYGVFDGTSHVVLEQIHWRLAQSALRPEEEADTLAAVRGVLQAPPQSLVEVGRRRGRAFVLPVERHARALAGIGGAVSLEPLAELARLLLQFTGAARASGAWDGDQGVRFAAAEIFAQLETLIAAVELADPDRRQALGLPLPTGDSVAGVYRFALSWQGARAAAALRQLWLASSLAGAEALDPVERGFLVDFGPARAERRRSLRQTQEL
jgi:alkylation response protein AidB-like acyl-CoA dehydrogenase